MTLEELYEALDIECPEDFKFYENFEAYIQLDEEIDSDILTNIFSKVEKEYLFEMIEGYFEGLINFVGEYESSFSMELEKEKLAILGLLEKADPDESESYSDFVIEIEDFRKFYTMESEVIVIDSVDDSSLYMTLLDAYWCYRGDKFNNSQHNYDFSNIKYTVDEYSMSINDLVGMSSFDDEDDLDDDSDDEY